MFTKLKIYPLIILLLSVSVLLSCNSDKEEPTAGASAIVGTWTFSSGNASITIDGKSIRDFLIEDAGLSPEEANLFEGIFSDEFFDVSELQGTSLIFKADGTFEVRENGVLEDSGTYELRNNNSILTLTSGGEPQDFDVKQLTNNRLTIAFTEIEEEDLFEEDEFVDIEIEVELTFTK